MARLTCVEKLSDDLPDQYFFNGKDITMKRRTFISLMGFMAAAGVLSMTGCSSKDAASSTAGPAPLDKLSSIRKSI